MGDEPAPDFITEFMEALAEGLATCAALAGERPVRDLNGDVTDELLAHPDAGLQRLEWAMVEMRARVADGRAEGGPSTTDDDIERIRRLRGLLPSGSPDVFKIAGECLAWWHGPDWREKRERPEDAQAVLAFGAGLYVLRALALSQPVASDAHDKLLRMQEAMVHLRGADQTGRIYWTPITDEDIARVGRVAHAIVSGDAAGLAEAQLVVLFGQDWPTMFGST